MSILIDKNTRVLTQGITGKTGQFHTHHSAAYAFGKQANVAGVTPGKGGQEFEGIPVFDSVAEAKRETGATVSVIYVPPAFAAAAIDEAVTAGIQLVICITEGIPVLDMVRTRQRMRGSDTLLIGPNCPGVITPDQLKIGIMPGHIHRSGPIGVVSRSGTLNYEAVQQMSALGMGQSTSVGIGGDPVNGTDFVTVLRAFEEDPETDAVIMIGEIGGPQEVDAARWAKENMSKPIVGFVAGVSAPTGRRMGHAGAIISGEADTANAKMDLMEELGVHVVRNPALIGETAHRVFS